MSVHNVMYRDEVDNFPSNPQLKFGYVVQWSHPTPGKSFGGSYFGDTSALIRFRLHPLRINK